jgi:tRNA(fMet)-specific endonuclease VapC
MEIVIDADVIIAAEKGRFNLRTWADTRPDDDLMVAAITIAEIWHGVWRAGTEHKAMRRRFLEAALTSLSVLPYSETTAYEHARIWADLKASGEMIGPYDLIVAATALERRAAVATFNKHDFSRVKGLDLVEPPNPQR